MVWLFACLQIAPIHQAFPRKSLRVRETGVQFSGFSSSQERLGFNKPGNSMVAAAELRRQYSGRKTEWEA